MHILKNPAAILLSALITIIMAGCGHLHDRTNIKQSQKIEGVALTGFRSSPWFGEQEKTFRYMPDVRIYINAPPVSDFDRKKRVELILYALPNGNTIEQTAGKKMLPGDDWHFNIQHIAAQTRFLRRHVTDSNCVVAYLETSQKSWPAWKRDHPDHIALIASIADSLSAMFGGFDTYLVLTGHSGGGSFVFDYIDGKDTIPPSVERISFLDSDYNYNDDYGAKLSTWLKSSKKRCLSVIAYNDSVALYEGKPFVSATGGTWYRSRMMQRYLGARFSLSTREDSDFIVSETKDHRIQFLLKKNPDRKIFHTVQVELNGFIQGMLSGTPLEGKDYTYYGERAYNDYIGGMIPDCSPVIIPAKKANALSGSAFIKKIASMSFDEREEAIVSEFSDGNVPSFLRYPVRIEETACDAEGIEHTVEFLVLPDYLAVGSDDDYCRMPMGPVAAQRIAEMYHASLPTRKLVDIIYRHADVHLAPVTYYPVGDANERVDRFFGHNTAIERRLQETGSNPGAIVAGIKKDIVLGNKIADPKRPGHVLIYGWHMTDGQPIQPMTNIHRGNYVDYSHGVRLIGAEVMLDGVPVRLRDILGDPLLYTILSDEDGPMETTGYTIPVDR